MSNLIMDSATILSHEATTINTDNLRPTAGDALIVIDLQNDFLPGGRLGVPHGDEVLPVINHYIHHFLTKRLPIFFSRDWHPADHCSFRTQGGPWPVHCVAGSAGAAFASELYRAESAAIISKATRRDTDAYSAFSGTTLAERLRQAACHRLFIGGLATEYCVLHTVKDAIANGLVPVVLRDAVRAVNLRPGDGERAVAEMQALGARFAGPDDLP
ncbi:MAG TPA: isochorismatase family protein [Azonexus sp.]|nr:isochorismatase family protein [Azonexus sp.]